MKATDLFNSRLEEFETTESFAKRVYETAKRYRRCLIFTPQESYYVIIILAKYYKESVSDILSAIRDLEFRCASKKYRIQWVKCLADHYLVIDKQDISLISRAEALHNTDSNEQVLHSKR